MPQPDPMRREPSCGVSQRWWYILLTLMCAGGTQIIYWLIESEIVSSRTVTVATMVVVPIATFILAADGPKAFACRLSCRHRRRIDEGNSFNG